MILSEGLAYDKCAVGVVTDMLNHEDLTEFYVEEEEHLFKVLRTQVDVVLPDGVAVLNASDHMVVELADLCDGKVIFYALDADLDVIAKHRAAGERAVFLQDNNIVLATGVEETVLLPVSSLKPTKAAQPECVLAAVAAAWALGITPELISAGLMTFESKPKKTNY